MKKIIIYIIKVYQIIFSPLLENLFGSGCRYNPTCSEYAIEAVAKFGVMRGIFRAVKRVLRCHPFAKGGYDPVKVQKSNFKTQNYIRNIKTF